MRGVSISKRGMCASKVCIQRDSLFQQIDCRQIILLFDLLLQKESTQIKIIGASVLRAIAKRLFIAPHAQAQRAGYFV